jgi:hypothetical protein
MALNDSQRFVCDGLLIGQFWLPPFEVCAGEFIKLELPNSFRTPWQQVLDALRAPCADGPIRASGKVIVAEWPRRRSPLLEVFRWERNIEWFCKQTGLTRTEALPWLERVGLPPDVPMCSQAGNPKKLLAIQTAFARQADVIVFDVAGIDIPGMRSAVAAVAEQLGDSAAICLATPEDSQFLTFQFTSTCAVNGQAPQPATP